MQGSLVIKCRSLRGPVDEATKTRPDAVDITAQHDRCCHIHERTQLK